MLQVLKEKMRLEGQLEALSLEANQALKELLIAMARESQNVAGGSWWEGR